MQHKFLYSPIREFTDEQYICTFIPRSCLILAENSAGRLRWTDERTQSVPAWTLEAEGKVSRTSDVLPWLQKAIHERYSMSKYDVERLGGTFTPQMADIRDGR